MEGKTTQYYFQTDYAALTFLPPPTYRGVVLTIVLVRLTLCGGATGADLDPGCCKRIFEDKQNLLIELRWDAIITCVIRTFVRGRRRIRNDPEQSGTIRNAASEPPPPERGVSPGVKPRPHLEAAPRSERPCRPWTAASRCARPEDSGPSPSARAGAPPAAASRPGSESAPSAERNIWINTPSMWNIWVKRRTFTVLRYTDELLWRIKSAKLKKQPYK